MRPIIVLLMAWCLSMGAYAATAPDAKQITQELEQAKAAKPAQPETVESLQSALNALEERKGSLERAQQYQQRLSLQFGVPGRVEQNGAVWRIQMGPFASKSQAATLQQRLQNEAQLQSFIAVAK